MTEGGSATSAYAADGREQWRGRPVRDHGWHPTFNRLLAGGHIFLGNRFVEGGVLFRGMSAGLTAALAGNRFWHYPGDDPLSRLERELNVLFCSEVPRDALAAARPWQNPGAAVLAFPSAVFIRRWRQRAAAMLGFADVGMVFRYPCLAEPLCLGDLGALVVHPEQLPACRTHWRTLPSTVRPQLLAPGPAEADRRESWTAVIEEWLAATGTGTARVTTTADYPCGRAAS